MLTQIHKHAVSLTQVHTTRCLANTSFTQHAVSLIRVHTTHCLANTSTRNTLSRLDEFTQHTVTLT